MSDITGLPESGRLFFSSLPGWRYATAAKKYFRQKCNEFYLIYVLRSDTQDMLPISAVALFSPTEAAQLRKISGRGMAFLLSILLLSTTVVSSFGHSHTLVQDSEPAAHQLSWEVPNTGDSLLLHTFRLQLPGFNLFYQLPFTSREDFVFTDSQKASLLVVLFLRHPFYTFTSIHAP
jgi:hypothetical protein